MRKFLPLIALTLAVPAAAQGSGPFTVQQTGQSFNKLDDALMAVRGQDVTVVIAPGTYHECAVQQAGHVTLKAARPGSVIFDGTTCEGKAALVLRGEGSAVDGIVFRNMRVEDGNGAGIRIELGDLTVTNSMFLDSQEGILGATDQPTRIRIDHSTFAGLGQCDETPDCAHSVYLATHGSVTITNSRFERGRGGHYVKIRAPRVSITNNSFDDTQGRKTNYAIDLPEGGTGRIADNVFVQGTHKENWTGFIVVAAEAKNFSSAGLQVEGNTASLAPGQDKQPAFVANASGDRMAIGQNRLGAGIKPYETR
ncbi:right-handed parallel beta-helix repeat-containing protein [Sphingomonas sp. Mn802worker]|uniref:right-handed parallel beta-helix repeat-containing protein n=1 Tax=Sphingomonas sp. Mn802worker TaxID=629773 RepID=UPI0003A3585F|nr:right-handed parallel beta-helix repeat-containing protein [Sphingomonas sp. Mn802worker]